MEVPYCHTVICHLSRFDGEMHRQLPLVVFCLRRRVLGDLQSPSRELADFQSARVTDPHLSPCGFGNPQGQISVGIKAIRYVKMNKRSEISNFCTFSLCFFESQRVSSGICNPRVTNCGFAIRAGHRPADIPLWIANPQGQMNCFSFVYNIVSFLPAFSKKACRKLKMFSVKNEPRPSERSEGVWRV